MSSGCPTMNGNKDGVLGTLKLSLSEIRTGLSFDCLKFNISAGMEPRFCKDLSGIKFINKI